MNGQMVKLFDNVWDERYNLAYAPSGDTITSNIENAIPIRTWCGSETRSECSELVVSYTRSRQRILVKSLSSKDGWFYKEYFLMKARWNCRNSSSFFISTSANEIIGYYKHSKGLSMRLLQTSASFLPLHWKSPGCFNGRLHIIILLVI